MENLEKPKRKRGPKKSFERIEAERLVIYEGLTKNAACLRAGLSRSALDKWVPPNQKIFDMPNN